MENSFKVKQWEEVYSQPKEKLPWTENPIPEKILEDFYSRLKKGDTVLDYGCGDGILSEFTQKKGFNIVCSDISSKALDLVLNKIPDAKTIQAEKPQDIGNVPEFDGLIAWGVLHHIDKDKWEDYVKGFKEITKPNGMMLIGGHSMNDPEFKEGYRISPTTGDISTALDFLKDILEKENLEMIDSGNFDFKETGDGKSRSFKYYLVKNIINLSDIKTINT